MKPYTTEGRNQWINQALINLATTVQTSIQHTSTATPNQLQIQQNRGTQQIKGKKGLGLYSIYPNSNIVMYKNQSQTQSDRASTKQTTGNIKKTTKRGIVPKIS